MGLKTKAPYQKQRVVKAWNCQTKQSKLNSEKDEKIKMERVGIDPKESTKS